MRCVRHQGRRRCAATRGAQSGQGGRCTVPAADPAPNGNVTGDDRRGTRVAMSKGIEVNEKGWVPGSLIARYVDERGE